MSIYKNKTHSSNESYQLKMRQIRHGISVVNREKLLQCVTDKIGLCKLLTFSFSKIQVKTMYMSGFDIQNPICHVLIRIIMDLSDTQNKLQREIRLYFDVIFSLNLKSVLLFTAVYLNKHMWNIVHLFT